MTAQITGFISRDQAGLADPESVSHNIAPSRGGVTEHYAGGAQGVTSHATCIKLWRGYQRWHMQNNGWVDVAYTGAVCDHGYAFAGRGIGVRTAANGTDDGNDRHYAIVWIGGGGERPTQKAYDAMEWWIVRLRTEGGAGMQVWPHSRHKNTSCPGNYLRDHARSVDGKALQAQEDEVMAGMPNWMKNPFRELRERGVYSKHTKWDTPVTSGELAVYMHRAGFSEMIDMVEEMRGEKSNPGWVRFAIRNVRGHRGLDHP